MVILGIETSCDETAASIIKAQDGNINVLSNVISSQVKMHAKWGGVVPNLAAREHLKNIFPVVEAALAGAAFKPQNIDLIAVTNGPGLIPALLIGTNAAKTLSYLWKKPLLGIHHIEGHIYANFIGENYKSEITASPAGERNPKFPILCLVVSGGHTQLILMKDHMNYKILGQTLDDAAGEAFDKVARILGLGYPGGPAIAETAIKSKVKSQKSKVTLPRPMINSHDFNFSFSGLKTAVLYETKKHPELLKNRSYISAMCGEFQQAVIDVLIAKTLKAANFYTPKTIMLAGGVSANKELRLQLKQAIQNKFSPASCYLLPATYSIDNAAMIASAAFFRWTKLSALQRKAALKTWKKLPTEANASLT